VEPSFSVEGLSFWYGGRGRSFEAVRDASFSIEKGEILGVLGESGAGKSTIGLALLGLVERPHRAAGRVMYRGKNVLEMSDREVRGYRWKDVAVIFQAAMNALDPVVTVGKNFTELLLDKRLAPGKREARAMTMALLKEVGLQPQVFSMFPFELSGGMKQRVMIAMALAAKPKLLVADEPTTALDTLTQFSILNLIKELRDAGSIESVLLISHDISVQLYLVDRMMVILGGRVLETAPKREIAENSKHPYTRLLLGALATNAESAKKKTGLEVAPDACPFARACPYVMEKCTERMPPFTEVAPGHQVACFLVGG
jgi:peptide/nickel transport system ATP-binding protein